MWASPTLPLTPPRVTCPRATLQALLGLGLYLSRVRAPQIAALKAQVPNGADLHYDPDEGYFIGAIVLWVDLAGLGGTLIGLRYTPFQVCLPLLMPTAVLVTMRCWVEQMVLVLIATRVIIIMAGVKLLGVATCLVMLLYGIGIVSCGSCACACL